MAEESKPEETKSDENTTQISFCPHLGIYHYKREDGSEYFFDTDKLVQSIETYQKNGQSRDAEFMAHLTAWARKFPHKVATFHSDGRFVVNKPEIAKIDLGDEESPDTVDESGSPK